MKVTLMPEIASISGSMKGKNGKRLVFKTYRAASTTRTKPETRAYLMGPYQRSTKPSEAELASRQRFAEATRAFYNLSDEEKKKYHQEWKRYKYLFNGKKYATLRGYIVARIYAGATI